MPRLVLDAGVFVSAALKPGGVCGQLFYEVASKRWAIVVCPMLLAELRDVLLRPKFRRFLSEVEVDEFLVTLSEAVQHVPDPSNITSTTPDPDDDYLVALASECDADWLVSGDAHLGNLSEVDVVVVTPRNMLDIIVDSIA